MYNIKKYFNESCIHGADSVPKPKPSGEGLLYCISALELKPSEVIFVGDSPSDGIASSAAKCISVGVSYGSHPLNDILPHFDHAVTNMKELTAHLYTLLSL